MTVACYLLGQKYYPIPYAIWRMGLYLLVAVGIYVLSEWISPSGLITTLGVNTLLLLLYLGFIYTQEKEPLRAVLKGKY